MDSFEKYYNETDDIIFKKMYDEHKPFLIRYKKCEYCENGTHTREQHTKLRSRAYKRLYDRKNFKTEYVRRPYKKDNFDIIQNNMVKV